MTRGSLPLKLRIPGCLPIRRLSGTHDAKMRTKLVRMIHALHEQGRDDLVNAIARGPKSGGLTALQVYNKWKFSRLEDLPHADELPRFADVWPQFLAEMAYSDDHHASYAGYYKRLEKLMAEGTPMSGLVDALRAYRDGHMEKGRSFEYAQNAAARLVKHVLGRRHRLYLEIRDVPGVTKAPKRKKRPLTPDQLRDLVRRLGEPYGTEAWTMATTGMGRKEYRGQWEREGDGLRIHGTKTKGRDRLVPLVSLLFPCRSTDTQFRNRLKKVTGGLVTPYDMRRTFTHVMVLAGVPRPFRKLYLGHSSEDITALYEWAEVVYYLADHGARMRKTLGEPEGGPTLQVVRA